MCAEFCGVDVVVSGGGGEGKVSCESGIVRGDTSDGCAVVCVGEVGGCVCVRCAGVGGGEDGSNCVERMSSRSCDCERDRVGGGGACEDDKSRVGSVLGVEVSIRMFVVGL